MRISTPVCPYCGENRKSQGNINTSDTFCSSCSNLRSLIARRAFSDRETIYLEDAGYIISRRINTGAELKKNLTRHSTLR